VALIAVLLLNFSLSPGSRLWADTLAPDYDGSYFKRVNLVVADIDRSLEIYRDVLGFDLDGVQESSADSYSYPVFKIPATAKLRFATLSAGDEQIRTLALTEVTGVELPKAPIPYRTASVIRSRDIERDFARLEALGVETTEPKFVEGREFSFWERAFVDFDGHLIVLYEILATDSTDSTDSTDRAEESVEPTGHEKEVTNSEQGESR